MPKLWKNTVESHRREVRETILEVTAALAARHGLRSVTMSQIAEETGIGRATLYKYFSSVEAILGAWHEAQVKGHLEIVFDISTRPGDVTERLEGVLAAFARISRQIHGHHDSELVAFFHRDEKVADAQRRLREMVRGLLSEGAKAGDFRNDVVADELTRYCLHALMAAREMESEATLNQLVAVIMAGLRPPA